MLQNIFDNEKFHKKDKKIRRNPDMQIYKKKNQPV